MAKVQTAVDVLERSLADIDAGGWICGTVCELRSYGAKKKADVKTMACAVGLVSLAAGHTTTQSLWLKGKNFKFDYALYPAETKDSHTINDAGRKALEYLYRAIPKAERSTLYGPVEDASIHHLQDAVVDYNDAGLATKRNPGQSARAWFARALKAAQKAQG